MARIGVMNAGEEVGFRTPCTAESIQCYRNKRRVTETATGVAGFRYLWMASSEFEMQRVTKNQETIRRHSGGRSLSPPQY